MLFFNLSSCDLSPTHTLHSSSSPFYHHLLSSAHAADPHRPLLYYSHASWIWKTFLLNEQWCRPWILDKFGCYLSLLKTALLREMSHPGVTVAVVEDSALKHAATPWCTCFSHEAGTFQTETQTHNKPLGETQTSTYQNKTSPSAYQTLLELNWNPFF